MAGSSKNQGNENGQILTGEIVKKQAGRIGKKAVAGVNGMDLIRELKDAYFDYIKVVEQEKTKRRDIEAWEKTKLAAINAHREVLMDFLDRSFDERKKNFNKLFHALDKAMNAGNLAAISLLVENIVDLAKSSPFKDLASVAQTRAMLTDQNKKFGL